jgi:S-DNA-T family DNA segregation ATPase FtsK/SpoIIIE
MNSANLIGSVAALYLREKSAQTGEESTGTARFNLDCLTAPQMAAVALAIIGDPVLNSRVEIKLPRYFLRDQGLPDDILTDQRATHFRNSGSLKPVILLANTGDDEEQSLKDVVPIGAMQLQDRPDLWVSVASDGLLITEDHRKWWQRALAGLQDLRILSLDRLAEYVLRTRHSIEDDGMPIIAALGAALPALRIPKDSAYFNSLNDKTRNHGSRWRSLYENAQKKRACYLLKQTPSQQQILEEDLQRTFEVVKADIQEGLHSAVESFIAAPAGWNASAAELCEVEWESIAPLFDGFKREAFNLGQETINFYEDREPELLEESERDYLRRLIRRRTTSSDDDDDRGFYENHRQELKSDRKLKQAWDRFVFGKPLECNDFLVGLALCLERLFGQQNISIRKQLTIRCDRATKRELRDLNVNAGFYFTRRYRGLRRLFGSNVKWDVGRLFDFEELVDEWKSAKKDVNRSGSRQALQLKFLIELETQISSNRIDVNSAQMIWKFESESVVSGFEQDWLRLVEHPLVYCVAHRRPLPGKGQFQTVDLANVGTFVPAFGRERGSFVSAYKRAMDLGNAWVTNLDLAHSDRLISSKSREDLRVLFDNFTTKYSAALRGLLEEGLSCATIVEQAEEFGKLLAGICAIAPGDRCRELLIRPLLQIGAIAVKGGQPTAIIAPWQPLRFAAMGRKAHLLADLIKRLLELEYVDFGDGRLFFRDFVASLAHPFYPEVAVGWVENQPELLCSTDCVADYTLQESAVAADDGLDDINDNPTDGANCVHDLVGRYLALQPHENANLSVVLYNCDSSRLPQAVVEKIGTADDDEDVRCQIILRHRDAKRLRWLYERIVGEPDHDPDAFSASEATRDFMARLRIGIMADQAPVPGTDDTRPYDIVFSQDVIARHARLEWYRESAIPIDADVLLPAHWSRRRPAAADDLKSVAYLCCPAQTTWGWQYLTAIATLFRGDWDKQEHLRLLPARQLDFRDLNTSKIFEETHSLGNWVVNFDELLDRRQLMNQNVRVIRYKQSATMGRNLIISSKAPLGLLRSMVHNRIRALNIELPDAALGALVDKLLEDAKEISGDIVLRAAKTGRNANELIGVVLSRYLIQNEIGRNRLSGWYFLDDYSQWLGQKEEQIADILALAPEEDENGRLKLAVIVSEAKYIDASSLGEKRKESQKQLRDTVNRINEALFGNPERLDRALWLSRLSDLILDGIQVPSSSPLRLTDWRRAIREGRCDISLRAYSHVFISGPSDSTEESENVAVAGVENGFQEVFSRRDLRRIIVAYSGTADPTSIRNEICGNPEWLTPRYSAPTQVPPSDAPPTSTATLDGQFQTDTATIVATSDAPQGITPAEPLVVGPWAYEGISELIRDGVTTSSNAESDERWLREVESRTKSALQQFQLQSRLVSSMLTPNSALLKFSGSANLTIDQVARRRSEFLTSHGLNIVSITPEPGVISIAIERPQRQIVRLQDVWGRWAPNALPDSHDLVVGVREDNGELLHFSPARLHAPHTLIAGSTGSGKSVLMQNILLGIAATNRPEDARIVLIDPKQGVDYLQLESLPHIEGGIIDNQEDALVRLHALVEEMDSRYSKLRAVRANSLFAYNSKVPQSDKLPVIWVIHDEFAEWMMVEEYKQQVTATVSRLGVKARAAGIHLVFAAQRPDANVMPMQLRANLGNRLILRVDSEGTSEIALGEKGAERLLGRGHVIAKLEGEPNCYGQVPFVDPIFMDRIVEAIAVPISPSV